MGPTLCIDQTLNSVAAELQRSLPAILVEILKERSIFRIVLNLKGDLPSGDQEQDQVLAAWQESSQAL